MEIHIKTQSIFNQRTARVGEFTYDKQGRMIITVALMSDERFCAVVAVEALVYALIRKHTPHYWIVNERLTSKRIAKVFAGLLDIKGKTKRKYNHERKALD